MSVPALAKQLGVSASYLVQIARAILRDSPELGKGSILDDKETKRLREYAAAHIPAKPVSKVDNSRSATSSSTRRSQSSAKRNKSRMGAPTGATSVKAKKPGKQSSRPADPKALAGLLRCSHCGAPVAFGLVTRTVLGHAAQNGQQCSGSGLPESTAVAVSRTKTAPPKKGKKKQPSVPRNQVKRMNRVGEVKKTGKTTGVSAKALSMSIGEERAIRKARYEDEFGGSNSVRTVKGGLPGLGRRG